MTTSARLAELRVEADRLRAEGAPASAFSPLWEEGWRPPSMEEGSGLGPCPPDCGVCHPELLYRSTRRKRGA